MLATATAMLTIERWWTMISWYHGTLHTVQLIFCIISCCTRNGKHPSVERQKWQAVKSRIALRVQGINSINQPFFCYYFAQLVTKKLCCFASLQKSLWYFPICQFVLRSKIAYHMYHSVDLTVFPMGEIYQGVQSMEIMSYFLFFWPLFSAI